MQSRVMTAQLAAYHAVHLLDNGVPCDAELMNAKLINVEYALDSARNAMEVHGAAGLYTDLSIERYLRDAHHIFAPAGTSDIQLLRLAEVALGTSKGQWSELLAGAGRDAAEAGDMAAGANAAEVPAAVGEVAGGRNSAGVHEIASLIPADPVESPPGPGRPRSAFGRALSAVSRGSAK
jgi:hypothetical protein